MKSSPATSRRYLLGAGSLSISLLLTVPGSYVGLAGLTDGIGPAGFAGLSELLGFIFCIWSVFKSTRLHMMEFFAEPVRRTGNLIAAVVLPGGFFLLTTVIGLEASLEHKKVFTDAMQSLGWLICALATFRFGSWCWGRARHSGAGCSVGPKG